MSEVPQVLVWDCQGCSTKAVADAPQCAQCGAAQPDDVILYPPDGAPSEEILLGVWDCRSCDGKGVAGDVYSCPNCGAGRPDDVEFYLPEDAAQITDAAALAKAKAGADWQCEYCDQWVSATIDDCPTCSGGEIATGKRQEVTEEVIDGAALAAQTQAAVDAALLAAGVVVTPSAVAGAAEVPVSDAPPNEDAAEEPSAGGGLGCVVIAVVLAALLCCGFFLTRSSKVGVEVTGHTWSRVQNMEELRVVAEEGWTKPPDAFEVRSEERVHHHDKVQTGVKRGTRTEAEKVKVGEERYEAGVKKVDLGNGRFKEVPVYKKRAIYETREKEVPSEEPIYKKVPRYQTYFRYKVKRWQGVAARSASGTDLEPSWPDASVEDASRQRAGTREETYAVQVRSAEKGKQYVFTCSEERWRTFPVGSKWTALVSSKGGVEDLRPLE
ncbi:MAG: hypothetical protein JKY65_16360 [Planctomycetes bacterium]|nr:hypothetical protein [Planctomycetota bacterium]